MSTYSAFVVCFLGLIGATCYFVTTGHAGFAIAMIVLLCALRATEK